MFYPLEGRQKQSVGLKKYWAKRSWKQLGRFGRRKRVIEEQANKYLNCGVSEWLGIAIVLEIDHIDGVHSNNSRQNVRGLCGNCHRQTPTYGFRKRPSLTNLGWFTEGDDTLGANHDQPLVSGGRNSGRKQPDK